MSPSPPPPPHIAIIGAGITGLSLAAGLEARHIPYTVYERAPPPHHPHLDHHRGTGGAGIGLSPNAERAMAALAPRVRAAYEAVANPNGEDYFQWVDGLTRAVAFRLPVGEGCFRGCRRGDLVGGLMGCVPAGRVRFGKALREVRWAGGGGGGGGDGDGGEGALRLLFEDGTAETADAVIGCDGIRSRVRSLLFGPSSAATYTHKYSFRALVPMAQAQASLPHHMTTTRFMYNGPGAHIITYPVANNTMLNTLAVVSDPNPWGEGEEGEEEEEEEEEEGEGDQGGDGDGDGDEEDEVPPATRASRRNGKNRNPHVGRAAAGEAAAAFEGWHPDVRAIVGLLPAEADRWAVFDMLESPAPRYHGGGGGLPTVCLAGDAAHAAGPHLGAGAGLGIEDALLLAELVRAVRDGGGRARGLAAAFDVYSAARLARTQWLVRETRHAADLFQWRDRALSRDPGRFGSEVAWRFHQVWDYDVGSMVEDARAELRARMSNTRA